jgi:branched-chain amino acid transport system permease protein
MFVRLARNFVGPALHQLTATGYKLSRSVTTRKPMAYFAQQILNGLHIGALYAVMAFGYAISNGLLNRANLAHGALFALGGQVTILAATYAWLTLWLILPLTIAFGAAAALTMTGFAAYVIGRSVTESLARKTPNAVIVATLGVAIFLGELGRFAFDSRDLWLAPLSGKTVTFWQAGNFPVTLTLVQAFNICIAAALLAAGGLFMKRSRFGRRWRAVCDDPLAAAMCGVNASRVFRVSSMVSGLYAASAGVLAAVHYGNISFETGLFFGLKVLFVAAFGYGRTPLAAAAGAFVIGIAEALWSGYFPSEWRDVAVFAALIGLFVLIPPKGEKTNPEAP